MKSQILATLIQKEAENLYAIKHIQSLISLFPIDIILNTLQQYLSPIQNGLSHSSIVAIYKMKGLQVTPQTTSILLNLIGNGKFIPIQKIIQIRQENQNYSSRSKNKKDDLLELIVQYFEAYKMYHYDIIGLKYNLSNYEGLDKVIKSIDKTKKFYIDIQDMAKFLEEHKAFLNQQYIALFINHYGSQKNKLAYFELKQAIMMNVEKVKMHLNQMNVKIMINETPNKYKTKQSQLEDNKTTRRKTNNLQKKRKQSKKFLQFLKKYKKVISLFKFL